MSVPQVLKVLEEKLLRKAYNSKVGAVQSARDVSDHPEITSIRKCVLCPCAVACRHPVLGRILFVTCRLSNEGQGRAIYGETILCHGVISVVSGELCKTRREHTCTVY